MSDTIIVVCAAMSLFCWVHTCIGAVVAAGCTCIGTVVASGAPSGRLPTETPILQVWPVVAAVIPARDESIGRAVRSLLAQDYPG